jgi:hypothetical protein
MSLKAQLRFRLLLILFFGSTGFAPLSVVSYWSCIDFQLRRYWIRTTVSLLSLLTSLSKAVVLLQRFIFVHYFIVAKIEERHRCTMNSTKMLTTRQHIFMTLSCLCVVAISFVLLVHSRSPVELSVVDEAMNLPQHVRTSDTTNSSTLSTKTGVSSKTFLEEEYLNAVLERILSKYDLRNHSTARSLLNQSWYKERRFDSSTEILYFFHGMKTGGTSLSEVLNTMGGVVPGSHESGHFDSHLFYRVLEEARQNQTLSTNTTDLGWWWQDKKLIYSHDFYRFYKHDDPPKTHVRRILKNMGLVKPVRQITIVRDPIHLIASNFNEWFCFVEPTEFEAKKMGILPSNGIHSCNGYTLADLAPVRVMNAMKGCANKSAAEIAQMSMWPKLACEAVVANKAPWAHCYSIHNFLNSHWYEVLFHNKFLAFATYPEDNHTADKYVEGALEHLGGLDIPTDADPVLEPDMLWMGVTERMKESMCVFHYIFELPYVETPKHRVRPCRPTNYWTEEEKGILKEIEQKAYAVYRSANAILDLQVAKMQYEVRLQLARGGSLENMTHIGPGCLEAAT